jgi:hypothetical protein
VDRKRDRLVEAGNPFPAGKSPSLVRRTAGTRADAAYQQFS